MILPTGATVAVADGETVRLFHNTGLKPGVQLVEITAAPPTPVHSGSGARHHTGSANPDGRRLDEDDFAAATAAFLNKLSLDGTIKHLVVVSDPRTLGGDAQELPPRPERQDHRRVREGLQPASARGHRLIDRGRVTRLWKWLPAQARPVIRCSARTTPLDHPNQNFPGVSGRPSRNWKAGKCSLPRCWTATMSPVFVQRARALRAAYPGKGHRPTSREAAQT